MSKESYNIKVQNFEGPMDLLLYFINRDKIDIYDIPIVEITKEYLEYIEIMELLDINLGADFIYMTSLLLQIKAKMLLPKVKGEDEEVEDPRVELIHRILEYKRFKNVSDELQSKFNNHNKRSSKGMMMRYNPSNDISLIAPSNMKLFDLVKTFKFIIDNLPENNELDLTSEKISLQQQIDFILEVLADKKSFYLSSLITKDISKIYLIGLFLAILELIKTDRVTFKQVKNFSDIEILRAS
tara:strand:- start:332 stop:1054 length:723 start_codon:yes stop_codon:yes gene_type:complete